MDDWLERGLKGRDEKGTIGKNRSMANKHLIPFIGKAKLKDLSADDVDDWLDGRAGFLATRSLRDLLAILRRSIEQAQRRDKAARNVALLVTAPEGRPGASEQSPEPQAGRSCARCGSSLAAVRLFRALTPQWRAHRGGTAPHLGSHLPGDERRHPASRRRVAIGAHTRRDQDQEEPADHRSAEAGRRRPPGTQAVAEAGEGPRGME
ncbi:hypothetical protein [Streptomyces echinatus]|uniref:hypothetical protein n=1 Tax=Streptomyces echinatus TaxID=67293 RepID=UPI0027E223CE|nr:hypothetical protein [Streptomyces echinatus]